MLLDFNNIIRITLEYNNILLISVMLHVSAFNVPIKWPEHVDLLKAIKHCCAERWYTRYYWKIGSALEAIVALKPRPFVSHVSLIHSKFITALYKRH